MKVLVTGGAGFIGTAVCRLLMEQGVTAVPFDDLSGGGDMPCLPFVLANVTSSSAWKTLDDYGIDAVIHLAASFANAKSLDDPVLDAQSNIIGTIMAAQFCAKHDIPLIYAASSSSYGKADLNTRDQPIPFREDTGCAPSTPYAVSKLAGEHYALQMVERCLSLRLFNVFGPGDRPGRYRNAIPNMVYSAIKTGAVTVTGEKSARDFTYIDKVAAVFCEAVRLMASSDWKKATLGHRVVNVCSGEPTSMCDIAHMIAQKIPGTEIGLGPSRAWDSVETRCGSTHRLYDIMGSVVGSPRRDFDADLAATIEWLKQHV